MDPENVPTVEDLANLLTGVRQEEGFSASGREEATARWLIDQVPETRELWREMNERPVDSPSLHELAEFHLATQNIDAAVRGEQVAHWLLGQVPSVREAYDGYRQLLRDVGMESYHEALLSFDWRLDRLVATVASGVGWSHPSEILDLKCSFGIPYSQILRLCEARARRAEGRLQEHLLEVARRLRDAGVTEAEGPDPD